MEATPIDTDRRIISISGDTVALGPFDRELLPLYQRWINDFEVTRTFLSRLRPWTLEAREEWYGRISKGDPTVVDFTIYERATMRPVGYTTLEDIDHHHRTARFGLLIGEKECWGRGYGTETTRLMLDYGFTILGLHNIMLTVFSYNERGRRAYARAGFRPSGRQREAHRFGDRVYDIITMDCLATEFRSPTLHQLLPPERPAE